MPNGVIAAFIASLCYQCGCEVGTSREAWYLQRGGWMVDRLTSNHHGVILISDSEDVGDALIVNVGPDQQSSPGEVGSDWVRVS